MKKLVNNDLNVFEKKFTFCEIVWKGLIIFITFHGSNEISLDVKEKKNSFDNFEARSQKKFINVKRSAIENSIFITFIRARTGSGLSYSFMVGLSDRLSDIRYLTFSCTIRWVLSLFSGGVGTGEARASPEIRAFTKEKF